MALCSGPLPPAAPGPLGEFVEQGEGALRPFFQHHLTAEEERETLLLLLGQIKGG